MYNDYVKRTEAGKRERGEEMTKWAEDDLRDDTADLGNGTWRQWRRLYIEQRKKQMKA
jgi:hypothetical protein